MRIVISLLTVCLLLFAPFVSAQNQITITFAWEQQLPDDQSQFRGWQFYYGVNPGGPYEPLGGPILWTGTVEPEYTASQMIEVPAGEETMLYFVVTALDKSNNESEPSNEVHWMADFKPPAGPINLRVTIIPAQ